MAERITIKDQERPSAEPVHGAASPSLRSAAEWALELRTPRWHYAAAEQLHGWREHAHHEGKPITLSRAAYEDALSATVAPTSDRQPSRNAVSPHRGKGL
jgi:hypothetical protein